eukprot:31550-Pelagococcus_subviridis.AAC.2
MAFGSTPSGTFTITLTSVTGRFTYSTSCVISGRPPVAASAADAAVAAAFGFRVDVFFGPFYTSESRGGVHRRQLKLKGVDGGDRNRGVGGERRREKSLRIGVHHANAVVWGPVYRTHLRRASSSPPPSPPSSIAEIFAFSSNAPARPEVVAADAPSFAFARLPPPPPPPVAAFSSHFGSGFGCNGNDGSSSTSSNSSIMAFFFFVARIICGGGASPPMYFRCGSLYFGSNDNAYFCDTHCRHSSTRNTLSLRNAIACFTTSSLNTASYTVHGAPDLSSSFRPSETLRGNRSFCVCVGSSKFASAVSTSGGSWPWSSSPPPPPPPPPPFHSPASPGAAIFACPHTLTKIFLPASSIVFTTNPGSGRISSRSSISRSLLFAEEADDDGAFLLGGAPRLPPPPPPAAAVGSEHSIARSPSGPPVSSVSALKTGASSSGASSGSSEPPIAAYC